MAKGTKKIFIGFKIFTNFDDKKLIEKSKVKTTEISKAQYGRLVSKKDRHVTLFFIGDVKVKQVDELIKKFPILDEFSGFSGLFDRCLFLPYKNPKAVSYRANFFQKEKILLEFRDEIKKILDGIEQDLTSQDFASQDFLPHMTLARKPFLKNKWKNFFQKYPFYVEKVTLFQSLGMSNYKTLYEYELPKPFEKFERKRDLSFKVKGETFLDLYLNAQIALCFKCPEMTSFVSIFDENGNECKLDDLDDVITALNKKITQIDEEVGCSVKAISIYSEMEERVITDDKKLLIWDMIVDL
jgi:RNA 2',3'-cyclic 3'-phosphodiesterase